MSATNSQMLLNCHPLLRHCHHPFQKQNLFSLRGSGEIKKLRVRKKVRPSPTVAVFSEEKQKPVNLATAEKTISITTTSVKLKAVVSVRHNKAYAKEMGKNLFNGFGPQRQSKGVIMQLVSTELDPWSSEPKLSKETVLEWSKDLRFAAGGGVYKIEFVVDSDFGIPGAV